MNIDASKVGYRWKGVYDENSSYSKGDVVRVGTKAQVFTDDNGSKEDFALGQDQFDTKNQVLLDQSQPTQGFDGMNLHSKSTGVGTYGAEFRHGRERNGGRAVALMKYESSDSDYVAAYHMGAIMSDGSLRVWGERQDSAYGFGTYDVNNMFPTKATFPTDFQYPVKKAWCYYRHTFVLDSNNVLWGTGNSWPGYSTGTGTQESITFRPISHQSGQAIQEEIVSMDGSYGYYGRIAFMALGASGKVYAWGSQANYRFGLGNNSDWRAPQLIPFTVDHPMRSVHCHNQNYSTASMIDTEGKLWTAGHSSRNMLDYTTDATQPNFAKFDPWGDDNAKVRHIGKHESDGHWASGTQYYFTGAITLEDGRAYIFGNGLGQVGYGSGPNGWSYGWDIDPRYPFHTGVQKMTATNGGYANAVAWMQDGTLEHRGYSNSSPTGSNTTVWNPYESTVSGYLGPDITNVADLRVIGSRYGSSQAVRTSDGKMICLGRGSAGFSGTGGYQNIYGTIGQGNNTGIDWVKCPKNIIDFSLHGYVQDDTGNGAIHALADDGTTWSWGWGSYGLQQDDDNENMGVPRRTIF